jgi:hypothetical protein
MDEYIRPCSSAVSTLPSQIPYHQFNGTNFGPEPLAGRADETLATGEASYAMYRGRLHVELLLAKVSPMIVDAERAAARCSESALPPSDSRETKRPVLRKVPEVAVPREQRDAVIDARLRDQRVGEPTAKPALQNLRTQQPCTLPKAPTADTQRGDVDRQLRLASPTPELATRTSGSDGLEALADHVRDAETGGLLGLLQELLLDERLGKSMREKGRSGCSRWLSWRPEPC